MLQDPETLQTYEEYAREFFYEAEGGQPPSYQHLYPQARAPRIPAYSPEETSTNAQEPCWDLCRAH